MKRTFKIGGEIEVDRMGFGAMRLTGDGIWGWPEDREGARAVLRRVRELGINFIDTADAYGPEISEYMIAETLYPYDSITIATKGGLERTGPGAWPTNGHPRHIRVACHNSLRRLGVDTIDLYQLHAIDNDVPLEDSVGEVAKLKSEGKVRFVGISNFGVSEVERARKVVDIATVQNRYNMADRAHDPVVDYCAEHGIGFIPWYPLAAGELVDVPKLEEIAERYEATTTQISLAWLLHRSPTMLPIPGTSSIEHLEENTASRDIQLSDEDVAMLTSLT